MQAVQLFAHFHPVKALFCLVSTIFNCTDFSEVTPTGLG
jgi:hypothetical protein